MKAIKSLLLLSFLTFESAYVVYVLKGGVSSDPRWIVFMFILIFISVIPWFISYIRSEVNSIGIADLIFSLLMLFLSIMIFADNKTPIDGRVFGVIGFPIFVWLAYISAFVFHFGIKICINLMRLIFRRT